MLRVIAKAATSDLTILATVKRDMVLTGTEDDAYLTDLIRRASDMVTRACRRTTFGLETVEQTERIARPRAYIVLERDLNPVITSVTVDGTSLVAGVDFELNGSLLYRLTDTGFFFHDIWTGLVVITYTTGWALLTDVPYDLEMACINTINAILPARTRDPLLRQEVTEGVGSSSWTVPVSAQALPPGVDDLLAPYRAVVVV